MMTYSCGPEFVEQMRPILQAGNLESLLAHLEKHWPVDALKELASSNCADACKVSLFCLSLVGSMQDSDAITPLLRHQDAYISKLAENALWSIWFRGSDPASNLALWRAVQMIGDNRLDEALTCLSDLLSCRPEFAEAYNQRSIVRFLQGDYEQARQDLEAVLARNPLHFAAIAGLGHCHAAEGRLQEALACYERALELHPRAEGLAAAVEELSRCLYRETRPAHPQDAPDEHDEATWQFAFLSRESDRVN